MIAVIKDAYGPALTEIGQASAHRLIETELDPMCEWCQRRTGGRALVGWIPHPSARRGVSRANLVPAGYPPTLQGRM